MIFQVDFTKNEPTLLKNSCFLNCHFFSTLEYLISGSLEQDLVPKITKFHIVKVRHLYVSNLNLIPNWPPNNKQMDIGPRNPQFNFKKYFFWLIFQQ